MNLEITWSIWVVESYMSLRFAQKFSSLPNNNVWLEFFIGFDKTMWFHSNMLLAWFLLLIEWSYGDKCDDCGMCFELYVKNNWENKKPHVRELVTIPKKTKRCQNPRNRWCFIISHKTWFIRQETCLKLFTKGRGSNKCINYDFLIAWKRWYYKVKNKCFNYDSYIGVIKHVRKNRQKDKYKIPPHN